MQVKQHLIEQLVGEHRLVQAASDASRPAYHVSNPSGRRKGVMTDVRVGPGGVVSGYVWLTSLPDRGSALLRRRSDLERVGTGGVCVAIQAIGAQDLPEVIRDIVDHLT